MGKRLTPEERARIIAEYADCGSYRETARRFEMAESTVRKIVKADSKSAQKCAQKKAQLEFGMLEYLESKNRDAQTFIGLALSEMSSKDKFKKAGMDHIHKNRHETKPYRRLFQAKNYLYPLIMIYQMK